MNLHNLVWAEAVISTTPRTLYISRLYCKRTLSHSASDTGAIAGSKGNCFTVLMRSSTAVSTSTFFARRPCTQMRARERRP